METRIEEKTKADLGRALERLGKGEAINRLMSTYGDIRTENAHSCHLASYLTWLREKGLTLTPDELIVDNLTSIRRSQPEDVATKRKHRAWLEEYVNVVMVEQDFAEIKRLVLASAVCQFYEKKDSPLFGEAKVSRQAVTAPPKPLPAPDVRSVLRALSTHLRRLVGGIRSADVHRVSREVDGVCEVRIQQGAQHRTAPFAAPGTSAVYSIGTTSNYRLNLCTRELKPPRGVDWYDGLNCSQFLVHPYVFAARIGLLIAVQGEEQDGILSSGISHTRPEGIERVRRIGRAVLRRDEIGIRLDEIKDLILVRCDWYWA